MFLVVGANGQLDNELRLLLGNKAQYVDKDELDITDKQAVLTFIKPEKYLHSKLLMCFYLLYIAILQITPKLSSL